MVNLREEMFSHFVISVNCIVGITGMYSEVKQMGHQQYRVSQLSRATEFSAWAPCENSDQPAHSCTVFFFFFEENYNYILSVANDPMRLQADSEN